MMQLMIMVTEAGKLEHTCNLLAEVNNGGKVLKVFDYNGNQLPINNDGTVMFNRHRWELPIKVDLK
ncbi:MULTISPECIES: hypothetical protein [Acinetobacter]|uniref:Uncharacterized protein n=4 Tax=Acinetobacter TaxID=469 RepID=A0AB35K660_9GAMM|nr:MULTISPECIES: hypothetical protein [Acinetobacter]AJB50122.1 hypothetical protein RR32_18520 [Acinetobacter nosocomialis]AUT32541.1 hypothetical protein C2U64_00880 [Acinetobacter pittii]AVN16544.1 hypothetical protein C6N19_00275 [Acinetobacter pittii]AVN20360.1 hypothetical protein C6N17_00340 [Acinetobacter pittii]AZB95861.1 hypothetical protein DKE46_020795 [Acinetobacter pittii]